MRRWLLGTAAVVAASQAGAQTAAPAVRPGEVTLHIVARGETTSRADRITLPVTVTGHAATQADAQAAAAAAAGQVEAALVVAGIDRAAIAIQPAGRVAAFDPAAFAALAGGLGGRPSSRTGTVTMQVTLADRAGLDRVTSLLATQAQAQAGTPVPSLRDDRAARRAAVADAVARAGHDADDYAAALGARVVRVTAVSNAAGLADGVETVVLSFRDIEGKSKAPDAVVTRATAVVDYVLAPGS